MIKGKRDTVGRLGFCSHHQGDSIRESAAIKANRLKCDLPCAGGAGLRPKHDQQPARHGTLMIFRDSVISTCLLSWHIALLVTSPGCGNREPTRQAGQSNPSSYLEARPLSSRPAGSPGPLFERLDSKQTGIHFESKIIDSHPMRFLYQSGFLCGGVAIGDVDGDMLPDIYLVNGPGKNKLFRQVREMEFQEIKSSQSDQSSYLDGGDAWGAGVAMADIDNDGDLDIYVCNYDSRNLLYVNQGGGSFLERAREFGVDVVDACLQPTFCDYDRDGDLDLYVLTYRYYFPTGFPTESPVDPDSQQIRPEYQRYFGIITTPDGQRRLRPIGRSDRLFRNDGEKFVDVSAEAGITEPGFGLSATWWDHDSDGWPDIYVGNDLSDPDRLYKNNGDGTFTDVIEGVVPHTTWYSMGADTGDINNDGRIDFLIADMAATTHFVEKTTMGEMGAKRVEMESLRPHQYMRNALYLNSGTSRFMESAYLSGLATSNWTWAVKLADFDNDGYVDAYFTNGMTRSFNDSDFRADADSLKTMTEWDAYAQTAPRLESNLAFRNMGDLRFNDVSDEWGLNHHGISAAASYADLDRDGDLDVVVANLNEPVSVYRNTSDKNNRLLVELIGDRSNRFGIGAIVEIETINGRQVRDVNPMTGFASCNDPIVHFGIGQCDIVRKLTVHWPSGVQQSFTDLVGNQIYTVIENDSQMPPANPTRDTKPHDATTFRSRNFVSAQHIERPYNDFFAQPLLPHSLAQLGPGIAWGDIDNDGWEDVYLSGAAGQPGQLLRNRKNGSFERIETPALLHDANREDMAPLFFDADLDGDQDLFVVSGGVEYPIGDERLRDRLYINTGDGKFYPSPSDALPPHRESGSVVCAADFDRDGDLDLFVGSRVTPGQYPLAPSSHLYRNEGGKLIDVTPEVCSALSTTGMVTSALWTDTDNDGWLDLLVTHDWGPVRLFRSQGGKLVDATEDALLSTETGWFNGISGCDLDRDGDIDYIVTNLGLNTKYHASKDRPSLLYYGDFDGSGRRRIVEAEFEGNQLFPMRGKSCSTSAIPTLGSRFSTYRSFASATLPEVYTPNRLEAADRFAATTFESLILVNDSKGRFQSVPLPTVAQIAPSYGIVITELTGDGNPDAFIAHNSYSPQWETGRMDGGLSLMLRGTDASASDQPRFEVVWPCDSGLSIPHDAKSVTICDFNDNGLPDLLVGVNNGEYRGLEHSVTRAHGRIIRVRLNGKKGNLRAVGARVTIVLSKGATQTSEVYSGGGYLSQSTRDLFFGIPSGEEIDHVRIRWPNGEVGNHFLDGRISSKVIIHQP